MQKDLSPLQTFLILSLFLMLGTGIFLFYDASLKVPRLRYLQTGANGHLYLVLGHRLYQYDASQVFVQSVDLNALNATSGIGNLGVFNDGELLLRQGRDERPLLYKIFGFMRMKNTEQGSATDNRTGLVRCNLRSLSCSDFGSPPLNLNDHFYLTIDPRDDRVYIADTTRDLIRVLDREGREIQRIDHGLKFPNKLIVDGEFLYVANTNRHEITVYRITPEGLVADGAHSFSTDAKPHGHNRWPSAMLLVDEHAWVVNANNSMAASEVILFDAERKPYARLDTPIGSDIYALVRMGGEILLSDYELQKIYRFLPNGDRLEDFQGGPLGDVVLQFDRERAMLDSWMWGIMIVTAIAFAIGSAIGVRQSLSGMQQLPEVDHVATEHTPSSGEEVWLAPGKDMKQAFHLLLAMLVLLTVLIIYLQFSEPLADSEIFGYLILPVLPMFLLIMRATYLMSTHRIGVNGETLTLKVGRQIRRGHASQAYYSHNQIGLGDLIVTLRTNKPLFREDQLVAHVYPLLKQATNIPQGQMLWLRIKFNRIDTALWLVSAAIFIFVYLELDKAL